MNVSRAQQIIESEKEIVVLHNGTPVWLQSIDENNQTARENSLTTRWTYR